MDCTKLQIPVKSGQSLVGYAYSLIWCPSNNCQFLKMEVSNGRVFGCKIVALIISSWFERRLIIKYQSMVELWWRSQFLISISKICQNLRMRSWYNWGDVFVTQGTCCTYLCFIQGTRRKVHLQSYSQVIISCIEYFSVKMIEYSWCCCCFNPKCIKKLPKVKHVYHQISLLKLPFNSKVFCMKKVISTNPYWQLLQILIADTLMESLLWWSNTILHYQKQISENL